MKNLLSLAAAVWLTGQTLSAAPAAAPPLAAGDLILATTTSLKDSGLLDVLLPRFEAASSYRVKAIAVGSGEALRMGEQGNADVLIVHSPADEEKFMAAGFGKDRKELMTNDFVLVGPSGGPGRGPGPSGPRRAPGRLRKGRRSSCPGPTVQEPTKRNGASGNGRVSNRKGAGTWKPDKAWRRRSGSRAKRRAIL